jgi:hypothetical protein
MAKKKKLTRTKEPKDKAKIQKKSIYNKTDFLKLTAKEMKEVISSGDVYLHVKGLLLKVSEVELK